MEILTLINMEGYVHAQIISNHRFLGVWPEALLPRRLDHQALHRMCPQEDEIDGLILLLLVLWPEVVVVDPVVELSVAHEDDGGGDDEMHILQMKPLIEMQSS